MSYAALCTILPVAGWPEARAREGGSWLVGRGEVPEAQLKDVPKDFTPAEIERWSMTSGTPDGRLQHLAPVVQLSETPARWSRPSVPLRSQPRLGPTQRVDLET